MTVFQTLEKASVEARSHAAAPHCSAVRHPSRPSFCTESRYRFRHPERTRLLSVWRLWRSLRHCSRLRGRSLSLVLVGAPTDVRYVLRQFEGTANAAYKVVGVVLDGAVAPRDATQGWGEVAPALCYVGIEEVDAAVRDLGADAVVVAGPRSVGHQYIRDLG